MIKTHSIAVFLLLCVIGTAIAASSVQDIYVSGDFLLTLVDDDDVSHASSLASYDPNTGKWEDKFGGVYQRKYNHPFTQIEYTNNGLFVTGYFEYLGTNNTYSQSVAMYTEANIPTGEFQGMGNGIWLGPAETISWIVGVGNTTLFAGHYKSIEDLSLDADDDEEVVVPNIAQWTSEKKWELLPNNDGVFPDGAYVQGVATSPDGVSDIAFIVTGTPTGLFSWTAKNGFNNVTPEGGLFDGFSGGDFIVDALGNPAGLLVTDSTAEGSHPLYSLRVIEASNNFKIADYEIKAYDTAAIIAPVIVPYLDGILIAVPQEPGYDKTSFDFFNSTESTETAYHHDDEIVPGIPFGIRDGHHLVAGKDGELWAVPFSATTNVTRYNPQSKVWTSIPLYSLKTVSLTVVSLTYDWNAGALYGYGVDTDGFHGIWFKIPSSDTPAPKELTPGYVSTQGKILTSVVVPHADDTFTLWVGGFFSSVGKDAVPARNIAAWKDGVWTGYETFPIVTMALYQTHTMFLAWDYCVANTETLPIGYFPVDLDNSLKDPFHGAFPLLTGGIGCISAMVTYKDEIFFGGNFTVQLPGSGASASAVIHYNVTDSTWSGIDIPVTIQSNGDLYRILSLAIGEGIGPGGADVLLVGGHFEFTSTNNHNYAGFAAYSLAPGGGWLDVKTFTPDTVVHEIIAGSGSSVFIGGSLKLVAGELAEGVAEYDFETNEFVEVGKFSNIANSILLSTQNADDDDDSNDEVTIFAGGDLKDDAGNQEYPVAKYDFTAQKESGVKGNWTKSGDNIFQNFFLGSANYLVYKTGGSGEGGENGNAPDPGSDSGMSGWWITVIVFVVLGAVLVVIAAAVAGVWYYKKKNAYQQID